MKLVLALMTGLSLIALSSAAFSQNTAAQTEYTPEEYTEQGQTNGCGISFVTVWPGDRGEVIGVSGSINFMLVPHHKDVMALIKANAILNGKKTPVSYAWMETPGYGRSSDFTKGPADDPTGFMGVKYSDPKAMALVFELAQVGSVLGVSFKGHVMDDSVKLPPASKQVQAKVITCFDSFNSHVQAAFN
jgi:hypothetical protein